VKKQNGEHGSGNPETVKSRNGTTLQRFADVFNPEGFSENQMSEIAPLKQLQAKASGR
jgi:hypothetical protein